MGLTCSELANFISSLAVLAVLASYVAVFHFGVEPFQREFYCRDESISYPYKPDTVTFAVAAVVGCLIIFLSVLIIEIVRHALRHNRACQSDRAYAAGCFGCCCCCGPESRRALATVAIMRLFLLAAMGSLLTEVVTVTLKTILGRHRPHFIDVCSANVSAPAYLLPCAAHLPISPQAVCRPYNSKQFRESMLSFPSGHASHSMYMTVFSALYLQSRFTFAKGHAVKWFLQCLMLVWGLAVCASRVSDYKHHWSDVTAGGIIGTAVAFLLCLYLRPSYLGCVAAAFREDQQLLRADVAAPANSHAVDINANAAAPAATCQSSAASVREGTRRHEAEII